MPAINLSGKQVLVTGGTGFIGGSLVERLVLECNAKVCVLVHNLTNASRIARFPIEMIYGDITSPEDVERAVSGCEIVFHCAYGNQGDKESQRSVTVGGTKNILEAARLAQSQRVVHLSTVSVYGDLSGEVLEESAPRRYSNNVYSDSKLDAEILALEYAQKHNLPVTVLQPTVVYGPLAPAWTIRILDELSTGRIILVDGGEGFCNAVYIDDLIDAMLLASVNENAVGQAFLISGENPALWKEFYGFYEKMSGNYNTIDMSIAEADSLYQSYFRRKPLVKEILNIIRRDTELRWRIEGTREINVIMQISRTILPKSFRNGLKKFLGLSETAMPMANGINAGGKAGGPNRRIHPLHPSASRFQAAKTRVSIDKAKKLLGYQPKIGLEQGMKATERWARWANLIDS